MRGGGLKPGYGMLGTMSKAEMVERLARLFEEGRVVIPSRIPVEELSRWRPESDASLSLRFAMGKA